MLAEITAPGRRLVEDATAALVGADFGLGALDDDGLRELSALLRPGAAGGGGLLTGAREVVPVTRTS